MLKYTPPLARVKLLLIQEILSNSQKTNIHDWYELSILFKQWKGYHDLTNIMIYSYSERVFVLACSILCSTWTVLCSTHLPLHFKFAVCPNYLDTSSILLIYILFSLFKKSQAHL